MVFDAKGYDQANIYVQLGTHATNGTTVATCKISESDTVTSISSMTDVVALTGGTVTSATVGFVLPLVAAAGYGTVVEFQIDLRKRKRFLALEITPGATTVHVGALGRLTRSKESADTAAEKAVAGTNNYSLTTMTSVGVVVTA